MAFNLKTYENQAKVSVMLAIAGTLFSVVAAVGMFSAFDRDRFEIILRATGMRSLGIMGSILLACVSGVVGFFMGLNGAGEKRNKAGQLSWMGFFMCAGVVALALSLLVFFYFTKNFIR